MGKLFPHRFTRYMIDVILKPPFTCLSDVIFTNPPFPEKKCFFFVPLRIILKGEVNKKFFLVFCEVNKIKSNVTFRWNKHSGYFMFCLDYHLQLGTLSFILLEIIRILGGLLRLNDSDCDVRMFQFFHQYINFHVSTSFRSL